MYGKYHKDTYNMCQLPISSTLFKLPSKRTRRPCEIIPEKKNTHTRRDEMNKIKKCATSSLMRGTYIN